MNIFEEIEKLILFGIKNNMIEEIDKILITNKVIEVLEIEDYEPISEKRSEELKKEIENIEYPCEILDNITNWAGENNKLKENILVFKDLLNSKIMGQIIPRTSEITKNFWNKYKENKKSATEYFYSLSKKSNYIRTDRISKNIIFLYASKYGNLEITINLSKPEKDPKEIALARNISNSKYPKSLLCKENEGYSGRINHPGRQNHRIIKLNLTNEDWYFQYSPYIYYNEHSIVFSSEIRPMKIDRNTFQRLLEFTTKFPHYFIGSNADIPIVGGSILSHDHFQAGRHTFAMENAISLKTIEFKNYDVEADILKWPLSVLRLKSKNIEDLLNLADELLQKWIKYTDLESNIIAYTDDIRHNSITPIARIKDNKYELDLVFRNNRTTEEYPLGIFHPHKEHHSIKKENIGLIEVMGLAVLPGRLKEEMKNIENIFKKEKSIFKLTEIMKNDEDLKKHIEWINIHFKENDIINEETLRSAIGKTFEKVLEDCKVFKNIDRFEKFLNS